MLLLNDRIKSTFQDAAKKLRGHHKCGLMAKIAEDDLGGSARKAERMFGWHRKSVQLGLHERNTGLICVDNYQARGRYKTEVILSDFEGDIHALVDPQFQAEPKLFSTFVYARISARGVGEGLITQKGYSHSSLPTRQTIGDILNRLGYRLKKHKKQNP